MAFSGCRDSVNLRLSLVELFLAVSWHTSLPSVS
uniref:Uncharacterized protein n=1 Tax=Anguilla anguilla TaxID=7936 RepID=A0A0E9TDU0_ANGAN